MPSRALDRPDSRAHHAICGRLLLRRALSPTLWGDLPLSTPLGLSLPTLPHAALLSYMGFLPYRHCSDTAGCLASSGIPGRAASVRTKHHRGGYGHHGSLRCKFNHPTFCQSVQSWRKKIRSQQYVAMKELLSDNMALHSQLDDLPAQTALAARPHRLREIESPLSWVFCFLAYIAVRTSDRET